MSSGESTEAIFDALQKYRDDHNLDKLQPAHLRLMARDAVSQGGLAESTIGNRLPRIYKDHALGMSMAINARLAGETPAPTGGAAPSAGEQTQQKAQGSTTPQWAPQDNSSTRRSSPDLEQMSAPNSRSTAGAAFEPTYEAVREGFVKTDRSREHEAAQHLSVDLMGAGFLLKWNAVEGADVLYRVTRSGSRVELPEWSEDTAIGTSTQLIDETAPDWPSIHYQVWAHVGGPDAAPRHMQPSLLAEAAVVVPPQDVLIKADQGRVFGTWRGSSHAGRVHVYRKPLAGSSGAPTDPQFRIQADRANLEGFVDTDVKGGKRYLYSVALEVMDDGVGEMSPFVEHVVDVPMRVEPVQDFEVIERANELGQVVLDLQWTPPAGASRVEIYISDTPPEDGLNHEPQSLEVFPQLGLGERLNYPVRDWVGDKKQIPDVLWQDGWSRMHFTAVSTLGDMVFPSKTITKVASAIKITEAALHQRVSHQVITLTWPQEAVGDGGGDSYAFQSVNLFRLRPGADVGGAIGGQVFDTIAATAYRQNGGMRVDLGASPCDIALVPVSLQGGVQFMGRPFVLQYQGLTTLQYKVAQPAVKNPFAKTVKIAVRLRAPEKMTDTPALVLVHNAHRLPLDPKDGREMSVAVKGDQEAVLNRFMEPDEVGVDWTETAWVSEVPASGFVRLFANLGSAQLAKFAVIDPPVKNLRTG